MAPRPYENLHIYLVNGILTESDESVLGETFIGNWVEGNSAFLFFSTPAEKQVAELMKRNRDLRLEDNYHFAYEDWQGGGLEALEIGPFQVIPPWMENRGDTELIKILLDPGVVFGNCLHPTTRTCLEALSMVSEKFDMGHVLDLGTGTGVLAIAAVLLGAEKALAVDLNPLCVKTAAGNIERNGLENRVRAVQGKAEDFAGETADLVLANIHHEVIRAFLKKNATTQPQTLIISGQMRSQSRDLKIQLRHLGFNTLREWDHDMTWFTILSEKP